MSRAIGALAVGGVGVAVAASNSLYTGQSTSKNRNIKWDALSRWSSSLYCLLTKWPSGFPDSGRPIPLDDIFGHFVDLWCLWRPLSILKAIFLSGDPEKTRFLAARMLNITHLFSWGRSQSSQIQPIDWRRWNNLFWRTSFQVIFIQKYVCHHLI